MSGSRKVARMRVQTWAGLVRFLWDSPSALVPEKLSAIRRCPLFGVSAIGRFLKYRKRSWYIAHCPLYDRCPLFGVSAKRGSTVLLFGCANAPSTI